MRPIARRWFFTIFSLLLSFHASVPAQDKALKKTRFLLLGVGEYFRLRRF